MYKTLPTNHIYLYNVEKCGYFSIFFPVQFLDKTRAKKYRNVRHFNSKMCAILLTMTSRMYFVFISPFTQLLQQLFVLKFISTNIDVRTKPNTN